MPTPCARKYSRVCAASPRTFSRNVSTATAVSPAGSSSASALSGVRVCALTASTSVRRPLEARSITAAPRGSEASPAADPKIISGAPSTHVPDACSNETALHLRADENAIERRAVSGGSSPKGAARVRAVALASGAVPYQPRVRYQPGASCSTNASP